MAESSRIRESTNDRSILLDLHSQLKTEKNHSSLVAIQNRINIIVAQNYLLWINGALQGDRENEDQTIIGVDNADDHVWGKRFC